MATLAVGIVTRSFREAPGFIHGEERKVALQGQEPLIADNLCDIIPQYENHIASETVALS